ncbi:MAG TPA: phosphoadenylyl-sulfate reductase [Bryobacteraceae bacterium]|nr:phosphoadenylyl-sulfate reductase [Bryobacteraceae bacterium]
MNPGLEQATPAEILSWASETYGDGFAVSTSFQSEGMVIVDMVASLARKPRVITLDTGRLPAATHQMMETIRERYGIAVEVVYPDAAELESMVSRHGPNLFYRQTALRMLCCNIRKVRPLERKLKELKAWAVGLRRSQNDSRASIRKVDFDATPVKISPLADWTPEQVEQYIVHNGVPRHPLYAEGYTSIGCDPCTRAVSPGEDERAGRWWWEQDADKECGIHFSADGRVQRTVDVLIEEILESRRA